MDVSPNIRILKNKIATENSHSKQLSSNSSPTLDCCTDFPPLPNCNNTGPRNVNHKERKSADVVRCESTSYPQKLKSSALEEDGSLCHVPTIKRAESTNANNEHIGNKSLNKSTLVEQNKIDSKSEHRLSPKGINEIPTQQLVCTSHEKVKKTKQNRHSATGTSVVRPELPKILSEEQMASELSVNINSREEYPELSCLTHDQLRTSSKTEIKSKGKPKYVSVTSGFGSTVPSNSFYKSSATSTYGWIPSRSFSDILKETTVTASSLKLRNSRTFDNEKSHEQGISKENAFIQKGKKEKKNRETERNQHKVAEKGANTSAKSKRVEDKKTTKKSQIITPLNLSDFIIRTDNSKCGKIKKRKEQSKSLDKRPSSLAPHNILDSTAPLRKRGKEREVPKRKQLSALKKIILKERQLKKNKLDQASAQLTGSLPEESPLENNSVDSAVCEVPSSTPEKSKDYQEIEDNKELESLVTDELHVQFTDTNESDSTDNKRCAIAKEMLHSRKFREYCDQFLSQDIDSLVLSLLSELVRFQDRLYQKDPIKAKTKKRLVCGLKEVTKHLKMKKVKVLVVSPDLEKINSEGGLDDMLTTILQLSTEYRIPCVFGLNRRKLGYVLKKKVPVCCVGIFSYEGAEETCKQLMEKVDEAKDIYKKYFKIICDLLKPELLESITQPVSVNKKQELWKRIKEDTPLKLDLESFCSTEKHEE